MKLIKEIVLIGLLSLSILNLAIAQNDVFTEKAFIEVTGVAEERIVPDQIYISISLKERQEGKEKVTIEKQTVELKTILKSVGIDLKNVQFTKQNASYVQVRRRKKDLIAKATYLVKVDNAKTVGELFDKLDQIKIKDAYISKVSHSNMVELRKKNRISAIKAAHAKAKYLLEAIGEQVGKPLKIYEKSNFGNRSNLNSFSNIMTTDQTGGEDEEIEFEKIVIRSSIYVKFEIK